MGEVRIKFTRNLVIDDISDELEKEIVEKGSIQLQIIDSSNNIRQDEDSKSFKWEISFDDSNEVLIQIIFENPESISSSSNTEDRLRILFVDTSFLKCESFLDLIEAGAKSK